MANHSHTCGTCGRTLSAGSATQLTQAQALHDQVAHGSLTRHGGTSDGRTEGSR
ncbi:hypothetical protein [Parafrankia discariae]|uniref:hypothetical protein n=1 Tax=Parafrankia discariae TaxID=365528 RepID=UPI000368AD83|nr:hypothetical protein [Parafrankia discariae]